MKKYILVGMSLFSSLAHAHDPIFSPGPHVLFKDGIELHLEQTQLKLDSATINETSLAAKYGITGDWVAGILLPYERNNLSGQIRSGKADVRLSTKYRFWRNDMRGAQESSAVFLNINTNTAPKSMGSDSTDYLAGFAYGYESLDWYRWASTRYLINNANTSGLKAGNVFFVDFTLGYRFKVNDYKAADTVWMLELNTVRKERSQLSGTENQNTGGTRVFITPGIMWTLRNFAVKSGIQIPLLQDLNGQQIQADYKVLIELEWHL